jgi:hypothetical protein
MQMRIITAALVFAAACTAAPTIPTGIDGQHPRLDGIFGGSGNRDGSETGAVRGGHTYGSGNLAADSAVSGAVEGGANGSEDRGGGIGSGN